MNSKIQKYIEITGKISSELGFDSIEEAYNYIISLEHESHNKSIFSSSHFPQKTGYPSVRQKIRVIKKKE